MIEIQTKQIIDVQDFDKLVWETYKKPYCFQQQDGCKSRGNYKIIIPAIPEDFENITIPEEINGEEMGVSFEAWLARDVKEWNGSSEDGKHIDLFWHRNFYPDIQMIANDLYAKGLIPKGEYLINIDW